MHRWIRPKKSLGQHFLKDENIARKMVDIFVEGNPCSNILEIGPGTGVLTKHLIKHGQLNIKVIELDRDAVTFLKDTFPALTGKVISADFLKIKLSDHFSEPFAVIGNFPYNISSQILFKVLENKTIIPFMIAMFQREVAQRITSPPGNKNYGILSVLIQAYYEVRYLFTVNETVFNPPPKVKSGVIQLMLKNQTLNCNEALFFKLVKAAFNQRRKTLRNALKNFTLQSNKQTQVLLAKRAEELNVEDFIALTNMADSAERM